MRLLSVRTKLIVALLAAAVPFGSVPCQAEEAWVSLFDGKSLDGWTVRGGFASYKAEDGMIVGTTADGSPNTFLCKGPFGDFVLEFDVLCDPALNSGVQIRSQVRGKTKTPASSLESTGGTVFGYQCEIAACPNAGNFWDESRAGKWWDDFSKKPAAQKAYKGGQWNHFRIVAQGDHMRSWINGVPCGDFHDKTDASGFLGFQVHGIKKGTGPYKVCWKNIKIRELKPGDKVE